MKTHFDDMNRVNTERSKVFASCMNSVNTERSEVFANYMNTGYYWRFSGLSRVLLLILHYSVTLLVWFLRIL